MIYVLWALLALAVLVAVLLCINVRLKVRYDDENNVFWCTAHYLFLRFVIAPKEEKKNKKKKPRHLKAKPKKKEEKPKTLDRIREQGLSAFLENLKTIAASSFTIIVNVLRRCVLRKLIIRLTVVGNDAAETAVMYGYASAVVNPIVSAVLENVAKYKELCVDIAPDFDEEAQASVEFSAELKLRPAKLIGAILTSRNAAGKLVSALGKK